MSGGYSSSAHSVGTGILPPFEFDDEYKEMSWPLFTGESRSSFLEGGGLLQRTTTHTILCSMGGTTEASTLLGSRRQTKIDGISSSSMVYNDSALIERRQLRRAIALSLRLTPYLRDGNRLR